MAKTSTPAPKAPAAAAAPASTTAAPAPVTKTSVNGQPAELPTPGTELGMTPGGAVIKASGVVPGQPKEAVNFKDAGKSYLAGLADGGATNAPAEQTTAEAITASVRAAQGTPGAAGAAPAAGDASASAAGDAEELPAEGEISYDPVAERWRDHTGKFVDAAPPTPEELAAIAAQAPAAGTPGTEGGAASPIKVTLPGIEERGEAELELEVDDPVLAARLEFLAKNGMRRKAFQEQRAAIDAERAELAAIDQALTVDPVGFALGRMTKERQIEVARALVLEHFDTLLPDLAAWDQDAAARERERVNVRDRMSDSSRRLTASTEAQQRSAACMRAAESLVPESVDPTVAQQFLRDAERDLIDQLRAGRTPTPEQVPQLLAHRASLYGFTAETGAAPAAGGPPRSTAAPAPASGAASATARPVTDAAKAIADRKAVASAAQLRIRRIATVRRTAASIAPAGVGAATVTQPVIPAAATVREASKALRKAGVSQSWTPAGS